MSEPIFKTRCTRGHVVIYEDKVALELKGFGVDNSESLQRNQITGVEIKTKFASIAGLGGAGTVIINSTGKKSLEAKMVKMKDAKKIRKILES